MIPKGDGNKVINLGLVIGQLTFGGAEKQQLYELVIRLNRSKFNPIVFCLSEFDMPYGDKIRKQNIKVHVLKRRSNFDILRLLKLASLLRKEKIELVHSLLYIATAYSYFACKLAGIRNFIPSILGYTHRNSLFVRLVDMIAINSAERVVTNSLDLKNYLAKYIQTDINKIVTIPNGIELDLFNKPVDKNLIKKQIGIMDSKKVIGIIAKDSKVKNISLFIETAKALLEQEADICFVLIGHELDEGKKEKWLKNFPLKNRFFFLGTREDIPKLLSIFDVFVLTSFSEGLPGVIIEAMAAGKPVVSTGVGGCPELVSNGKNGFLVPSNNKNELIKAIKAILNDKEMAIAMGKAGRKFIEENFSMGKMVRETEELYLQIMG